MSKSTLDDEKTEQMLNNMAISSRDAVRREALKYFSSNPGLDTAGPNTAVHSGINHCLTERDMSLEDLTKPALKLLYRNTLNHLAQSCVQAMGIAPICECSEFDLRLRETWDVMRDRDVGMQATHIFTRAKIFPGVALGTGFDFDKPGRFVAYSLVAAGILPGHGLEEKIETLRPIVEKEAWQYFAVRKEIDRCLAEDPRKEQHPRIHLLPLCCNMNEKFEYDKQIIKGCLAYRNEANEQAYSLLEALDMKPYCLFEKHGVREELDMRGQKAQAFVSMVEDIIPGQEYLSRKTKRYIAFRGLSALMSREMFTHKLMQVKMILENLH